MRELNYKTALTILGLLLTLGFQNCAPNDAAIAEGEMNFNSTPLNPTVIKKLFDDSAASVISARNGAGLAGLDFIGYSHGPLQPGLETVAFDNCVEKVSGSFEATIVEMESKPGRVCPFWFKNSVQNGIVKSTSFKVLNTQYRNQFPIYEIHCLYQTQPAFLLLPTNPNFIPGASEGSMHSHKSIANCQLISSSGLLTYERVTERVAQRYANGDAFAQYTFVQLNSGPRIFEYTFREERLSSRDSNGYPSSIYVDTKIFRINGDLLSDVSLMPDIGFILTGQF